MRSPFLFARGTRSPSEQEAEILALAAERLERGEVPDIAAAVIRHPLTVEDLCRNTAVGAQRTQNETGPTVGFRSSVYDAGLHRSRARLNGMYCALTASLQPARMTTLNLSLQPAVLRWARERAGLSSDYIAFYRDYEADERRHRDRKADGGSFWNSQNAPLGERFGAAVAHAVKEGRLLYRDAYRLTALRGDTFTKLAERILSASH